MRKQWTISLSLLTLSLALTGCGNSKTESITDNTVAIEETETTVDETTETSDEESTEEISEEETSETEETKDDTTETIEEPKTETPSEEQKNETSNSVATEKPTESSKPNNSASSNTNSKPGSSSNTSTSKPNSGTNTTTKPETSTKPSSPNKPQTPPTTKPESTPSTKPESTPTVKPEVSPSPSPEVKPEESTPSTPSLSCSSIYSQITAGLDLSNQLSMDATLLKDYYGIDTSLLEDFSVQVPMMSFSITEIGVFKAKDASAVDQIVSAINNRANNIGVMLYPSLEDTYNSRQVVTKGNYILFVISDDVNQIVSKFNTLV